MNVGAVLRNTFPIACVLLFVLISVSSVSAQEKQNPFANNILGTLSDKRMVGELELLDEQKENIDALLREFGDIRKNVGQDMKADWEAANEEQRKELGKEYWRRIEEGRLEIVKQLKSNLLPHQIERVEQLSAQRMMRTGKGRESAGLLSDQMIDYLGLSENQKERIKQKSDRLKEEVSEKIQKILEEARQELLAELNSNQKLKYEKLVGEPASTESKKRTNGNKTEKKGKRKL